MSTCIITGCQLNFAGHEFYWGDLHEQGDQFIFYCLQATALHRGYDSNTVKEIRVEPCVNMFERKGVWVFPKSESALNSVATNYLRPDYVSPN